MKKKKVTALTFLLLICLCISMNTIGVSGEEKDPTDGGSTGGGLTELPVAGNSIEFEGHTYRTFYGYYNWNVAMSYCQNLGGHLATITSQKEQDNVMALTGGYENLWIGGYRDDNHNWYWVTGEPWDYTNWGDGEPNNSSNVVSNENKVAVWPEKWNDLNDSNIYEQDGFICEWDDTAEYKLYKVTIRDRNGETIPYARVKIGNTVSTTDESGCVVFNRDMLKNQIITVNSEGYYGRIESAEFDANNEATVILRTIDEIPFGDINGDTVVDSKDKIVVLKCVGNMLEANEQQVSMCDYNGDGKLDLLDAIEALSNN